MSNDLSVFERGARGERGAFLFLSGFMLLLGGGGGLYLAMEDLSNARVARAFLKGGLLAFGGLATFVWAYLKKYPGIAVLRDAPARIRAYSVTPTAVLLELQDKTKLRLPLQSPNDVLEGERVIKARAPAASRL